MVCRSESWQFLQPPFLFVLKQSLKFSLRVNCLVDLLTGLGFFALEVSFDLVPLLDLSVVSEVTDELLPSDKLFVVDRVLEPGLVLLLVEFVLFYFDQHLVQCQHLLLRRRHLYCLHINEIYNHLVCPHLHQDGGSLKDLVVVLVTSLEYILHDLDVRGQQQTD